MTHFCHICVSLLSVDSSGKIWYDRREVKRMFLLKWFVKDYENTKDPVVRAACGKLSGIVGIVCNLLLFAAKLVIGTVSGAVSITADAVNNLSDASGSIVTLLGFRLASQPADEEHPYGHARMEYFSGLVLAAFILVIGVELAKTSVQKILHPEPVQFSAALVIVLVLSIAVKIWLALFNLRLGRRIRSKALEASGADSRNDVLATSAVLLACIIGKVANVQIDGWVGAAVALFILWSGIQIARDTIDPLLGAAPDETLVEKLSADLLAHPLILGIHDVMIHDYGPGRQFATAHAEIDSRTDVLVAHEVLDLLERQCMKNHRVILTIHYDPIVTDNELLNRMKEKVQTVVQEIDERLSVHDFRMVAGQRHTNLIFDLAVPFELHNQHAALREKITAAVQFEEDMEYHVIINFDDIAFNQPAAQK